jgi:hypothetical protein
VRCQQCAHSDLSKKKIDEVVPDLNFEMGWSGFSSGGASVEKREIGEDIRSVKPCDWVVLSVYAFTDGQRHRSADTEMIVW